MVFNFVVGCISRLCSERLVCITCFQTYASVPLPSHEAGVSNITSKPQNYEKSHPVTSQYGSKSYRGRGGCHGSTRPESISGPPFNGTVARRGGCANHSSAGKNMSNESNGDAAAKLQQEILDALPPRYVVGSNVVIQWYYIFLPRRQLIIENAF